MHGLDEDSSLPASFGSKDDVSRKMVLASSAFGKVVSAIVEPFVPRRDEAGCNVFLRGARFNPADDHVETRAGVELPLKSLPKVLVLEAGDVAPSQENAGAIHNSQTIGQEDKRPLFDSYGVEERTKFGARDNLGVTSEPTASVAGATLPVVEAIAAPA